MNIEALRQAVKFAITEHETEINDRNYRSAWKQGDWAQGLIDRVITEQDTGKQYTLLKPLDCGTTCCIAGNVVYEAGWVLAAGEIVTLNWHPEWPLSAPFAYNPETGDVQRIEGLARQILGITEEQATDLFAGSNDIDEVIKAASRIASAYGHELGITL